jgi:zinc transporter 9
MRFISSIGTGLLVGTALVVIIPEGIETMYNAKDQHETKAVHAQGAQRGGLGALAAHRIGGQTQGEGVSRADEIAQLSQRAVHEIARRAVDKAHSHTYEEDHAESSHAWIGIALVLGFILMYLIDALSSSHAPCRSQHIPLTQLDNDEVDTHSSIPNSKANGKATTIGLVIHSLADGIALGASSASTEAQNSLGLIVFAAILVHKAPAAFGLTSVLLKQGLGKRAARAHLLVFSLAAPVGALVTWTLVNFLGSSRYAMEGDSTWWTGLVLVFSGGTFL